MSKPNYLANKAKWRRPFQETPLCSSEIDESAVRTPKHDVTDEDVMTTEEAALFLRTSRPSLIQSVKRGEVPCLKIGTTYRFSREALKEAMKEKKTC